MEYFFRFAYPTILIFSLLALIFFAFMRLWWYKRAEYRYSLGSELAKNSSGIGNKRSIFFFISRFLILFSLAILVGRPQLVDPRSKLSVEGIDMMLVLDVSGSMRFRDYGKQKKERIDVAKSEAIRFIKKRDNDPIGLVIFGKEAISRCPITDDKKILTSIVKDLHIGVIDPEGTSLALGILTAANRMKDSTSKSKIMIVLTDGEPSGHDARPETAIEVAKRMGIKIYTIGIGSDEKKLVHHPFYGLVPQGGVNKKLLQKMAQETGGKFFMAEDQKGMRRIYDTIDNLEKTEYEMDVYGRQYDIFMPFLWFIFVLLLLEIMLSSFIWFGL